MTDRPRDTMVSGEVALDDAARGASEAMPRGLAAVAQQARSFARVPVGDAVERLGRERLMAAAMLKSRPVSISTKLFSSDSLWSQLQRHWVWPAALVAVVMVGTFVGLRHYSAAPSSGLALPGTSGTPGSASLATASASNSAAGSSEGQAGTAQPGLHAPIASNEAALTYSMRGGKRSAPNYLVAPARDSASLRFSDGSEVTASPGARIRVDSTNSRGARVLVEQGVARAHITHREFTNWMFAAGPFDVRITGTTFTLSWDASAQVLDLTLHEGSVEVASPLGASRVQVKTGQRYHASVAEGTMQLLAADSETPATADREGRGPQARSERRASAAAQAQSASSKSRTRQRHNARHLRGEERDSQAHDTNDAEAPEDALIDSASLTDLVRAGAFEKVVDAATRAGLAQTLEHSGADDVRALADAARYLHRTELAVRSLTVLRTRFPGTHHSAAAAFLLGRTYENAEQAGTARRFYELYERESPNGELAAEALAGRMRVVRAAEGAGSARPLAEQYLSKYPRGVHAKTARSLLREN